MTAAPQITVGTTLQGIDDTTYSVFQLLNGPGGAILLAGNFFLGLQAACAVVIPLGEQLGLTRGGKILTDIVNAAFTFTAAGTWTAGGTILCNVMVDDSPRGSSEDGLGEAGPFDSRLAWKSPNGFGPAWRPDFSGVFDHRLEDTGGSPFVDTLGLGTTGNFGMRAVVGHREQLAVRFVVPAGPNWSIARALAQLRRFGAPIGSMEVALQGDQSDGFGHDEPDGVDLGVSAAVLNSTIPLVPATGSITYAFTPDVVLAPGTYWMVLRPSVPYPISVVNFIVWMQQRLFTGGGSSHRTLLGERFDIGNYPGNADVALDVAAKEVGTDIVWNPIARVSGQSIQTPDLSPLVGEVIKTSGHETASAICFTFRTVGETRTYRFAAHDHATLGAPGFFAQFSRRQVGRENTGG